MSSRADHRRRDRSWERDDRDRDRYPESRGSKSRGGGPYRDEPRRRSSRSRSPRRDRDSDRRGERRDRDYRRDNDDHRDGRNDRDRERRRDYDEKRKDASSRDDKRAREIDSRDPPNKTDSLHTDAPKPISSSRPNLDPDAPDQANEEGEATEDLNDDDAAMTAMMGVTGFGSTKGKHVSGNQEGAVHIKKVRTWRQYMNRRGGFNRPLDKIK